MDVGVVWDVVEGEGVSEVCLRVMRSEWVCYGGFGRGDWFGEGGGGAGVGWVCVSFGDG